ncbi:MAG: FGGY-family carbohydrate kinase [Clostridia bacterium]|nr:FGGY-family carbohydrate kinase [Clostridia bacterium]
MNTNNPLVLTFDCGTQSMRAVLVDKQGNVIDKAQVKYNKPYISPQPGWAEQPASTYWDSLCTVSKQILSAHADLITDIICVTVTTIRDTFLCLDKDGKPLNNFIVWLDQRRAECKQPLSTLSNIVFSAIGMREALNVQRKITKSNWIKEYLPDVWDKTYKYVGVSGWLIYNLVGDFVDCSASQVGHIPFDYKPKKWKSEKDIQFALFGVESEKLIRLVDPTQILGTIDHKASQLTGIPEGLPVIASGSDKECETLGSGVLDESGAALSFGTAASVQISTKKYVGPTSLLPAYPAICPDLYNPEVQIYRGYWMVSWFLKEFAEKEVLNAKELGISPEELLNRELDKIKPGCDGLMLQPYWSPLLKQPEGRGSMIGFNSEHTRIHIYRAIIEGIGFALYDGLLALEKRSGNNTTWLAVAGGGSQSDTICQITADMFNLPVRRVQTYESTGLGSSIAGFVGMGCYDSFQHAVDNMVHFVDEFRPNPETHAIYQELYQEIYRKTYARLQPLYRKLYSIIKY